MGQKYVTIDKNNIVQEPFDEDNNNVPVGAVPITDDEFRGLSAGFDMFKYEGGVLVINPERVLQKKKEHLIQIEQERAVEALISAKRIQIENMNEAAIDAAIEAGGL